MTRRPYRENPALVARRRQEAEELAALHRSGVSVREIARLKNTWPTNIRTKLLRFGLLDPEAGHRLDVRRRQHATATAQDERAMRKWGCSFAQYLTLRGKNARAFQQQRRNASDRGIGWELNLWQWWTIWQESGRWLDRGHGRDGFVMCRTGDVGPYAVGNVYIATNLQNIKDGWINRRVAQVEATA